MSNDYQEEFLMKFGARNKIIGKVSSIKKGDVMSLIKVKITKPIEMGSVITTESLDELEIKVGDEIELVIKAVNVLPVKEK